jgi:60 kDa SS-A/Ro ribonucleoprotein
MKKNNAGGYGFAIDDWGRLDRFLVLGSEGGTYYVNERTLTVKNAEAVRRCVIADGLRVVSRLAEISESGRAPKNDPALFVLAMCASIGDDKTRSAALSVLPKVARIGTHLFHFLEYVEGFRGWGRGLRKAVANWYNMKPANRLAYQVIKYQQRDGWSHRDALRLAHPKAPDIWHNDIYSYITRGKIEGDITHKDLGIILAFEAAEKANKQQLVELILDDGLTREMIPTKWLNDREIWEALLQKMPLTAMIRNLGKMSQVGLIAPMSDASGLADKRLRDQEYIKKSRLHPLAILTALKIYEQGRGLRGNLSWVAVPQIVDALDEGFYLSFGNVEEANKRLFLGLDVSGSMGWGAISGSPLTPRDASAAMALITAKIEPACYITAFSHEMVRLSISPRQRLDDVIRRITGLPFGGTDCALPMLYALDNDLLVDAFVVYTDNETWFGDIHPIQALDRYRQKTGIAAKLVVVGMKSNGYSIADPNDGGMLDIVGFDTETPQLLTQFINR